MASVCRGFFVYFVVDCESLCMVLFSFVRVRCLQKFFFLVSAGEEISFRFFIFFGNLTTYTSVYQIVNVRGDTKSLLIRECNENHSYILRASGHIYIPYIAIELKNACG